MVASENSRLRLWISLINSRILTSFDEVSRATVFITTENLLDSMVTFDQDLSVSLCLDCGIQLNCVAVDLALKDQAFGPSEMLADKFTVKIGS